MRRMVLAFIVLLALAIGGIWLSCSHDETIAPSDRLLPVEGDEGAALFEWAIGPIEGITTVWHSAPEEITVPVGTTLHLKCADPGTAALTWLNTGDVRPVDGGSIAEIRVEEPGTIDVSVESSGSGPGGGGKGRPGGLSSLTLHRCVITGVDVALGAVRAGEVTVVASPLGLSESSPNEETMRAFFAGGERYQVISQVTRLSTDRYASAVNRIVTLRADATDPRFTPLIEVRVPGLRPKLVGPVDVLLETAGEHAISVGPTASPKRVVIETYSAAITNPATNEHRVAEDRAITFKAKTTPPGYERFITWVSSTKHGTATPVLGQGPSFTVTFRNTWGPHDEIPDIEYQWLGVRADNAVVNQDQKVGSSWEFPYDGGTHQFAIQGNARFVFTADDANVDSVIVIAQNGGGQDLVGTASGLQPGTSLSIFVPEAAYYAIRMPNIPNAPNATGTHVVGDLAAPGDGWPDTPCFYSQDEALKGTATGSYTVKVAAKNSQGNSQCSVTLKCYTYDKDWLHGMQQAEITAAPGQDKTLTCSNPADRNIIFWVVCGGSPSQTCRITIVETKTP